MLAFFEDIWQVLAALVIFVITALAQGIQKARRSRREAGGDDPLRGPTPTFDQEEPWATAEPPPLERTRRAEPRPAADDWEAELRRLLGGEPAAPPPPPPPVVVQIPSPPPSPPPPPAPPEPMAVPRPSAAEAALARLTGQAPAAFQHRPAQRPSPAPSAARLQARRLAERWRDPRNAREAVIASLILGPPKALEERPGGGLAAL